MSFADNDQPLGEEFLQNPYEYFQSFVRNMNNEVFLSEYQLGHLYALLLLKKQSPWDEIRPNSETMKADVENMVNLKVSEVKKMLESLSMIYESKFKKNTFTQIERLMSILKAKNKSIFIEKDYHSIPSTIKAQGKLIKNLLQEQFRQSANQGAEIVQMQKEKINKVQSQNKTQTEVKRNDFSVQTQSYHVDQFGDTQIRSENKRCLHGEEGIRGQEQNQQKREGVVDHAHDTIDQKQDLQPENDQRQVLSLFYGIANIPNLSSLALGNCLQYSAAQRYIKFQMSKNYIMTIRNDDELSYDRTSVLRSVSSDLFIHRIFPYLTAVELFKARGVCKQWMENVKEAWHSTFKREMFIQLMACEFCKEIQFYYKMIQLRNPFFQKVSLLMHALIEIIQWDKVYESIENNTLAPQLKKVLIILLKLLGEDIVTPNLNSITEQVWLQHKQKTLALKQRIGQFLNNIESSGLSILQLMKIKLHLLDDPFMRVEELNSDDKTPLLLVIFIKQLTLQQILKNHIYFSQQYLMNTKRKLDNISSKMPQQRGFLQGVYKIILLRNFGGGKDEKQDQKEQKSQLPNFASILSSIFDAKEDMDKPDFVLKSKSSLTNIYMDKATKMDIIISTVKKMNSFDQRNTDCENQVIDRNEEENEKDQKSQKNQQIQNLNNQSDRIDSIPTNQNSKKKLQSVNIYNINLGNQQNHCDDTQQTQSMKENQYEQK